MTRRLFRLAIAWFVIAACTVWLTPDTRYVSQTVFAEAPDSQAFVNQDRVVCHNQRLKTAGLMLDTMDPTQVAANADAWEKVVRKIKRG